MHRGSGLYLISLDLCNLLLNLGLCRYASISRLALLSLRYGERQARADRWASGRMGAPRVGRRHGAHGSGQRLMIAAQHARNSRTACGELCRKYECQGLPLSPLFVGLSTAGFTLVVMRLAPIGDMLP